MADITFVDTGAGSNNELTCTPGYPTVVTATNMLVMSVASRSNNNATPSTPTGWLAPANNTYNGGSGAFGADSGNGRITVFYKEALGSETGTVSVATNITPDTAGFARARIFQFSKASGVWLAPVVDGGVDSTAGTAWSVTGSGIDVSPEDHIFAGSCSNDADATYSAHALAASGITFGAVTELEDQPSFGGSGQRLFGASASITAGSGSGAMTYTATASATAGNAPAGTTAFVRLRAGGLVYYPLRSDNFF